ncbi:helix-turn-helix transcriptional regulator [Bordetella genomosp. 1]|uniref:Helix-turn-helix transcriptional regulator n=1 Tax=Bordetella genomosp. 1 TaxID=1395607 RepID=A0A261SH07_9BORD|nr:response regulator transcription factor [Bordetella genomosp. 1]OZI36331.1 helix-turn-helix transcriptional regulator [Bordetella genomosp. 1]
MPTPVLLITHDDLLWQHWRELDATRWLPARGRGLADLERWRDQGRTLVVLDTDLPRLPAWQAPTWAGALAGLQVIVASPYPNDEQGTQALGAGAMGYCHGYAPTQSLAQVLEVVSAGGTWMGRSLVRRLLQLVSERGQRNGGWTQGLLTEREIAVAHRAAYGQANAQIAAALGITERTVKAHLSAVFDKLGVSDRLQLALLVHGVSTAHAQT